MNGFLIDTNFVSEYAKPFPNQNVIRWFHLADPTSLFASVITVGEIRSGIENLPLGRRRNDLESWFETGLPSWFDPNVLPVSRSIADHWGRLTVIAKRNGMPTPVSDLLIAATALEHQLTLVTRNTKDFSGLSVQLLNPWEPS